MTDVLLPHHAELIVASAITPEVAAARGYRSETDPARLRDLGFAPAQCRPGLLIPLWGTNGKIVGYQLRPDEPRRGKAGKAVKYETPTGWSMRLDVHPFAHADLGDPTVRIVYTEGARKGDAAVSHALCAVSLLGVWNWRGRNGNNGLTALPDFHDVAHNGRETFLGFDSDAGDKCDVFAALDAFSAWLRTRDADVWFIELPHGPDGVKWGLDDYFAAGHTTDDLFARATRTPRRPAKADARQVVLTPASAIQSERVRWLADRRVPLRGVTAVAGEKGLGKSTYTNAHMVAAITRGTLDGELLGHPADVLILTAEDDWRAVVKPRLMAYGADLERVHRVEVHDADGESLLTLPDDVRALDDAITALRAAGRTVALVVVDPVGAFISETTNTHAEAPVRRVLAPLAALADRHDLAVVAVMHLNKDDAKRLISRVSGAGAFVNAARSVLVVVPDPDDPEGEQGTRRLILHVRTNWGRLAPTLAAHMESRLVDTDDGDRADVGYLIIDGESATTVDDVQRGPDDHADDAEQAVGLELANGPRPSLDVKTAVAKRLGCSHRTVERAAERMTERGELAVDSGGFPRTTTWRLAQSRQLLSGGTVVTEEFGATASNQGDPEPQSRQSRHGSGTGATGPDDASPALFDGRPDRSVIPAEWQPYGDPAEPDDERERYP